MEKMGTATNSLSDRSENYVSGKRHQRQCRRDLLLISGFVALLGLSRRYRFFIRWGGGGGANFPLAPRPVLLLTPLLPVTTKT